MLQLLVILISHKSALNYFKSLLLPNRKTNKNSKESGSFFENAVDT